MVLWDFGSAALSQSVGNRTLYFAVISDTHSIALAAFPKLVLDFIQID